MSTFGARMILRRLIVLTDRRRPTETFLDSDLRIQQSGYSDVVLVELSRLILPFRSITAPFKSLHHQRIADQLVRSFAIKSHDVVLSYWANFVFDIAYRAARRSGALLRVFGHAQDVFCSTYLGKVPGHLVTSYSFCCRKTLVYARSKFRIDDARIQYHPHQTVRAAKWKPPGDQSLKVINIARDVPKKNLGAVTRTIEFLARSFQTICFDQIGTQKQIRFTSPNVTSYARTSVPHQEAIKAMENAHLMIYGSRIAPDGDRDGVPNVLREAGAMGLPVVCERGWANDEVDFKGPVLMVESLLESVDHIGNWISDLFPHLAVPKKQHVRPEDSR